LKDQITAGQQSRHATEEANLAHVQADRAYTTKVQQIQSTLPLQLQQASDAAAKKLAEIRKSIAAMSQAVIAANDQLRKTETAIQKAIAKQEPHAKRRLMPKVKKGRKKSIRITKCFRKQSRAALSMSITAAQALRAPKPAAKRSVMQIFKMNT